MSTLTFVDTDLPEKARTLKQFEIVTKLRKSQIW